MKTILCIICIFFTSSLLSNEVNKTDEELLAEIMKMDKELEKQDKALEKQKKEISKLNKLEKTVDKLSKTLNINN